MHILCILAQHIKVLDVFDCMFINVKRTCCVVLCFAKNKEEKKREYIRRNSHEEFMKYKRVSKKEDSFTKNFLNVQAVQIISVIFSHVSDKTWLFSKKHSRDLLCARDKAVKL